MAVVIDTSVFIRAERNRTRIDLTPWRDRGTQLLCAITVSELIMGIHRANTDVRRLARRQFVERVLSTIPALDFTSNVARIHAEVLLELKQRGTPIGLHDLLIAATARFHGLPVLTCNVADFSRVPGLEVLDFDAGTSSTLTSPTKPPSP